MGCGWTPAKPVDMRLLTAVEAVNGGSENPLFSGIRFWEHQLSLGYRLTAIGGSDNHRPMLPLDNPGAIGRPTTVVYASELSAPAILDGIRSGRVFVDLTGSHDRLVDLYAQTSGSAAAMGGQLRVNPGDNVSLDMHVEACSGAVAHLIVDGQESASLPPQPVTAPDQDLKVQWKPESGRHWLLAEIRDSAGHLLLLSNPIYVNWDRGTNMN